MSKQNPYGLPPPWNPGYAVPQNVVDEGLERHGYVTQWARRGTFDDPKVGTAGYAVPEYVKQERYGRGAMVTRWAPRGSYAGPRVPHWLDAPSARVVGSKKMPGGATSVKIRALAGVEEKATGVPVFTQYGLQVARDLMASVSNLPDSLRKPTLKKAMDRIDPTLYSRAEKAAQPELKAGASPAVALERGIAWAASHGLAAELVAVGKGAAVKTKSQLGLVTGVKMMTAATFLTPQPVICPGYSFVTDHWERTRVGQADIPGPGPGPCGANAIRVSTGGTAPPAPQEPSPMLEVGPFVLPLAKQIGIHYTLNAEQSEFVNDRIKSAALAGMQAASMINGTYPFAKFRRPDNPIDPERGKNFGLYYKKDGEGKTYILYKEYVPSAGILGSAWNAIKWVASKVVDVVKAVVETVKDAACSVLSSGVGQMGAAAAGAAVGGPGGAQAGAMGAQVVANACASPPPVCDISAGMMIGPDGKSCVPIPPVPSSSMMPILLIGGAGLAAILILGKKKTP